MDQTCTTCGDPCPNVQCIACWEKEVLGVVAEMEAGFRNVRDYGAAGDGTTDDTAAVQRAMNAGRGFLPAA